MDNKLYKIHQTLFQMVVTFGFSFTMCEISSHFTYWATFEFSAVLNFGIFNRYILVPHNVIFIFVMLRVVENFYIYFNHLNTSLCKFLKYIVRLNDLSTYR